MSDYAANSVGEYLMGALPNLASTTGYIPSNKSMSFALQQPKLFAAPNYTQFDGGMNLIGDSVATSSLPSSDSILAAGWQPKTLSNFSTDGFNLDAGQGVSLDSILGKGGNPPVPGMALTDKINAGVGLFNAGLSAINSFKTNKLAKEQFAFQKDAWNKEYAAQRNLTNAQLADRQAVRYREHPELNMSPAEYMAKYGV